MDYSKCDEVVFEAVRQMAGLKYIPTGYILGGIGSACAYKGVELNPDEEAYVLQKVTEGLTYIFKNFEPSISLKE